MNGGGQAAAATATPITFHRKGRLYQVGSSAKAPQQPSTAALQRHTSNSRSLVGRMEAVFSLCLHRKWAMYSLHLIVPSLMWMSFSALPLWEPTSGFSWANATWAVQWLVIMAAAVSIIFEAVFAFTQDEDDVYLTWQEPLAHLVLSITVTVIVPQALDVFPIPYFAPVVASTSWVCIGGVISFRYVNFLLARKIQSVRADETLSCDEREEELAFLQNPRTKRRVLIAILCLVMVLGSYVALVALGRAVSMPRVVAPVP